MSCSKTIELEKTAGSMNCYRLEQTKKCRLRFRSVSISMLKGTLSILRLFSSTAWSHCKRMESSTMDGMQVISVATVPV